MTEFNLRSTSAEAEESLSAVVPVGTILAYGGHAAPGGWALCDGAAVNRTTYAKLFLVLGTYFGVGDGSTTFNLPDMRGRLLTGDNDMGGVDANRRQLTALLTDHLSYGEDVPIVIGATTGGNSLVVSFIIKLGNAHAAVASAYPVAP